MNIPVKLSNGEMLVKSYELFKVKRKGGAETMDLFVTNKRVIVSSRSKRSSKVIETSVKNISDIETFIYKAPNLIPAVISLVAAVATLFFLPLSIILFVAAIVAFIIGFCKPNCLGTIQLCTNRRINPVLSVVGKFNRRRRNSMDISRLKLSKDFEVLQGELGAVIADIQAQYGSADCAIQQEIDDIPEI